jgi:hypothetical protein
MEKQMSKFAWLGGAALLASLMATPSMAQQVVGHPNYVEQTGVCPGHEAGNPYSKEDDYMAWSGWRSRGGWDDRNDLNCVREPRLPHRGAAF